MPQIKSLPQFLVYHILKREDYEGTDLQGMVHATKF